MGLILIFVTHLDALSKLLALNIADMRYIHSKNRCVTSSNLSFTEEIIEQNTGAHSEKEYYGHVDGFEDNYLYGWFYSGEKFPNLPVVSLRTELGVKKYQCNSYREDINQLGLNHGYCGFRIPVNLNFPDSFDVLSENMEWTLPKNPELILCSDNSGSAIKDKLFESIHHVHRKNNKLGKKIAIYSAFLPDPSYYSYHRHTIKDLQELDFLVILVVPVNRSSPHGEEFNAELYNDADVTIIRDNLGYDFGSYAAGLAYALDNYELNELVFLNDSIISTGDKPDFLLNTIKEDFWGVTESFEHTYHIQSYCFGFSMENSAIHEAVIEFFFGRGFLYTDDKKLVIERFELAMTKFFSRKGIKPKVLLQHDMLFSLFINNDYYNTKEFESYFNVARETICMNVSHFYWREAIKLGFPFIKKELLVHNPTHYPKLNSVIYDTLNYEKIIQINRDLY